MRVIDPQGNKIFAAQRFPEEETGWEFIKGRLNWKRSNVLCPYIFSRNVYIKKRVLQSLIWVGAAMMQPG